MNEEKIIEPGYHIINEDIDNIVEDGNMAIQTLAAHTVMISKSFNKRARLGLILCLTLSVCILFLLAMSLTNSALHIHTTPECFFSERDKYEKISHDDGSFCMPVGRELKHFYCCKNNVYRYVNQDGSSGYYPNANGFGIANLALSSVFIFVILVVMFILIDHVFIIPYERRMN